MLRRSGGDTECDCESEAAGTSEDDRVIFWKPWQWSTMCSDDTVVGDSVL